MILGNRRLRLLFMSLAAMDVAVFLPFVYLFWDAGSFWQPQIVQPLLRTLPLFLLMWGALLLYILILEILGNTNPPIRTYYGMVVGMAVTTTLIGSRLLLHGGAGFGLSWVGETVQAIYAFNQGIRPEFALFLVNLFLWQRAANATSRDIQFFGVGLSFRLGVLLLLVGGGLVSHFSQAYRDQTLPLLWLFFGFGLFSVALARLEEKSQGASGSRGMLMSGRQFGQLFLATCLTMGGIMGLARFYTPQHIRAFLGLFSALWQFLGMVGIFLLGVAAYLLEPLFNAIFRLLSWLLSSISASEDVAEFLDGLAGRQPPMETTETVAQVLPGWLSLLTRYGLVTLAILLALGAILFFLGRFHEQDPADEAELVEAESLSFGGGTLRRGLDRLRDLGRLLNRYRLSDQLLAAISVQNIYANVSRLARRKGYPRPPSQAPDDYLPALQQAFPHAAEPLARITATYMRIYYGEKSIDGAELAQIRVDYQTVKKPPSEQEPAVGQRKEVAS